MNGADIKNYIFSKSLVFGYKKEDVSNCLREISEYVVSIENKLSAMELENKRFKEQIAKYRVDQDSFKEIIASAQEYKRKVVNEAKTEADKLLSEAKNKAENLVNGAETKANEELRKVKLIEGEVSNFKSKLISAYKAHVDAITNIPENMLGEKFDDGGLVEEREKFNFEKKPSVKLEVSEDALMRDVLSSSGE